MTKAIVIAAAIGLLSACGGDEAGGGLSAEENRGLNEAAEMLDTSPDSLAPPEEAIGNETVTLDNSQ